MLLITKDIEFSVFGRSYGNQVGNRNSLLQSRESEFPPTKELNNAVL